MLVHSCIIRRAALVLFASTTISTPPAALAQCESAWLPQGASPTSTIIYALATRDFDGAGPAPGTLFAGGVSLGPAGYIGQWSDAAQAWQPLGTGVNGYVYALACRSGSSDVFAGGIFTMAGDLPASHIARWDGAAWHAMGDGLPGTGAGDGAYALTFLANGQLAAGVTYHVSGIGQQAGVFVWNGQTWEPLGGSFAGMSINALAVHNGELFAGGLFTRADGDSATNIARWDGSAWHGIGGVIQRTVFSLQSFRGELFAGGFLGPSPSFAAWNGQSWRTLPNGPGGTIQAMTVFNGDLIAGGVLSFGSEPTKFVAKWSGTDGVPWHDLDGGVGGPVYALTALDTHLAAGGNLTSAGGLPTDRWARWRPELLATSSTNPSIVSNLCDGRGRRATLTITAHGTLPISYQWRHAGVSLINAPDRISGATTPTLSILHATYAESGPYDCIVTASCGSVTSAPVTLAICFADYNCQGGITIDDVFTFLADYFARRPAADVNGSGGVTVQDLLDFIAGYLGGC